MIAERVASSLPDWALIQHPLSGLWILRRAEDGSAWLAHPSRPNDLLTPVPPDTIVQAILPLTAAPALRVPADEVEAITNLAQAGFTVEMIRKDTT